ncbi:glycosyltransferase family 2 protein [Candidatus Pacearchaeota archaeon]|nr:glycosyltransferase family 2 protein [Candidatus Pacearchaeota archaeon]
MLVPWLSLFDLRTAYSNFIETKKISPNWKSDDFVILIPIFNDVKYLTNIKFLKRYKGKVILCTTNMETDEFYNELEEIARKNKFKVIKCDFKKEAKNPWKIYQKTLLAHDYVLGKSMEQLKSKYVVFLDADTTCRTDLSYLAGSMERYQLDLASVRVIPSKRRTIVENLQHIEYHTAMKSRRIYPWLTSGAAMIGKREDLIKIMSKHSLFFNGGDIEIGKLANLEGLKIDHLPVTFYTDVPQTFPKLIKQRFSWFCGAFRHSVINAHTNFFSPIYAFYFTIIIFLMLPLKMYELFTHWFILPFLFLFYFIVNLISNLEIKNKRYLPLFPLYSLFQILVLPVFGVYRYGKTVIQTGNLGIIKKFYKNGYHPIRYSFNILILIAITFFIFNIHLVEGQLLLGHIDLFSLIGINFNQDNSFSIIYNGLKLTTLLTAIFLFLMGFFKTRYHLKFYLKKNKNKFPKLNYLLSIL